MPLKTQANGDASATNVTTQVADANGAYLAAGGEPCIGVHLVNRARRGDGTYSPAHIKLTPHNTNRNNNVCQQVLGSQVVTDYFNSTVPGTADTPISAAIPVGSSKGIYKSVTPKPGPSSS